MRIDQSVAKARIRQEGQRLMANFQMFATGRCERQAGRPRSQEESAQSVVFLAIFYSQSSILASPHPRLLSIIAAMELI
jgi:hypothetical protein